MTGYLTKFKAEMERRLGCGIEVVEDRDLGCSCKICRLDGLCLPYKQTYENAIAMFESRRGKSAAHLSPGWRHGEGRDLVEYAV